LPQASVVSILQRLAERRPGEFEEAFQIPLSAPSPGDVSWGGEAPSLEVSPPNAASNEARQVQSQWWRAPASPEEGMSARLL